MKSESVSTVHSLCYIRVFLLGNSDADCVLSAFTLGQEKERMRGKEGQEKGRREAGWGDRKCFSAAGWRVRSLTPVPKIEMWSS